MKLRKSTLGMRTIFSQCRSRFPSVSQSSTSKWIRTLKRKKDRGEKSKSNYLILMTCRNSSTIIKMQEIKNISVYWNSMSEMFIPTSICDQSQGLQFGIFEFIEADLVHEMMKDIFTK